MAHGEEDVLYGDQASWKADHRDHWQAEGGKCRINRRGTKQQGPTAEQQRINRSRSRTRVRVEHSYHVVKRLRRFTKVRCRGLAKNLTRSNTLFRLASLYLVRRRLLPNGRPEPATWPGPSPR